MPELSLERLEKGEVVYPYLHHNTMTAWETAVALKELIENPLRGYTMSYQELAEVVGKTDSYISDMLMLLDEEVYNTSD